MVNVKIKCLQTREGPKAYEEAIKFLEKQKTLRPMKWQPELYKASKDHVQDIGPRGTISSIGSDGEGPSQRIARYGAIDVHWAESNIFGANTAKEAIERLIVCDG